MKRKLASMTAMVLVLMVGIMGTMAYLSTVSNSKHNTFTGSKGISLGLTEPGWDADDDDNPDDGDGMKEAQNYTPGKTIAKDPTLTNTTTAAGDANAQEWVAMAITFQINNGSSAYTDVSYAALQNLITPISFNTTESSSGVGDNWVLLEPKDNNGALDTSKGYAIFMYNKPLKSVTELGTGTTGQSTRPLFNQVVLKDTTGLTDGLGVLNTNSNNSIFAAAPNPTFTVNGNLPGFKINVIGAAVKNEYKKWDSGSGAYTADLASDISELKTGTNTDDKEVLESNLKTVLYNALTSNNTLGYVTKSVTP